MSLEVDIVNAIASALPGVPVTYGYAVQDPETVETVLPFVVVQRGMYEPLATTCGPVGAFLSVDVYFLARDSDAAWMLADLATPACLALAEVSNKTDGYDPDLRAWAVILTYRAMTDD